MSPEVADSDSDGKYSESELRALTVQQLKDLAKQKGWELTKTKKDEIIAEILAAQG
nr:MAG TPA: HeH/LEM domain [Caudoviricetes sp.]